MSLRMRVGWIPASRNRRVASTRLRCHNIIDTLAVSGFPVELHSDRRRYDVVVFSKRYDADAIKLARRLRSGGARVVFDLCDNHFYNPERRPERDVAGRRLAEMLSLADAVVSSTSALAEVVRARTGRDPLVIPDAVEDPALEKAGLLEHRLGPILRLEPWRARRLSRKPEPRLRIIWFGAHGVSYAQAGMLDLLRIREELHTLDQTHPVSLTIVSNNRSKYLQHIRPRFAFRTRYFEWNPYTFYDVLSSHDICIIPVTLNQFTMCKTNNRLALALHRGLPVVADAIPSYEEFRDCAFLNDWSEGLQAYATDVQLREKHVAQGQDILNERYSLEVVAETWRALFEEVVKAPVRPRVSAPWSNFTSE